MPIMNVTVTNLIHISIYIKGFKTEFQSFPFFTEAVTDCIRIPLTHKKLKIECI